MYMAEKYANMQLSSYNYEAHQWSIDNRDAVVGTFDLHNEWADYEYLFIDLPDTKNMNVLDFGTGPGRNLVKYANRFKTIDGVDICQKNIDNAKLWIEHNNLDSSKFTLYTCNGTDLDNVPNDRYDLVMSTIVMQHICVYEIRKNYFKEFFRVLCSGGFISIQMGFGIPSPLSVSYYENYYDASSTNRGCDVAIGNPDEIKRDLEEIGFTDFKYHIRPTGPGDCHPNWIYFTARKQ
jgi:ubiquinone/menaquinone biosynthesis C-methylase UbiE